jgi:segregation and condensation protein A
MDITLENFEGPLDLLLHLIKKENMNIYDISISKITAQYLKFINEMQKLNLNIASEYLVMSAELIEIKASTLLPKQDNDEEDPKEELIKKLLDYAQYKELTSEFKDLKNKRAEIHTKDPENLQCFAKIDDETLDLQILLDAFDNFLKKQKVNAPLSATITKKEYSLKKRIDELKNLLKNKKNVPFEQLFDIITKEYIIVTFLAVLNMAKSGEIKIIQEKNLSQILISEVSL